MAQPSLDILHSIPKIEQNRGTAMPEIVVTDRAQIVLFQQLLKFRPVHGLACKGFLNFWLTKSGCRSIPISSTQTKSI